MTTSDTPSLDDYLDLYRKWYAMHGMQFDEVSLREEWSSMTRHRRAFNLENIRTNVTIAAAAQTAAHARSN